MSLPPFCVDELGRPFPEPALPALLGAACPSLLPMEGLVTAPSQARQGLG